MCNLDFEKLPNLVTQIFDATFHYKRKKEKHKALVLMWPKSFGACGKKQTNNIWVDGLI